MFSWWAQTCNPLVTAHRSPTKWKTVSGRLQTEPNKKQIITIVLLRTLSLKQGSKDFYCDPKSSLRNKVLVSVSYLMQFRKELNIF